MLVGYAPMDSYTPSNAPCERNVMPIPKVGDVIELHDPPSIGGDWYKLSKGKMWIVESGLDHAHQMTTGGLSSVVTKPER